MPWRKWYRDTCIVCGRERDRDELFSGRGKCPDCGDGHMLANAHELRAHRGPWFQHWRRAVARSVGATLDDDAAPEHTD